MKTKEIASRLKDNYALDTLDDVAAARTKLKRERRSEKDVADSGIVDREAQETEWQKAIVDAAIKAEQLLPKFKKVVRPPDPGERAARRVVFLARQQEERTAFRTSEQSMLDRHAGAFSEMVARHAEAIPQAYETREAVQDAEQAITGGFSFLLSFFTAVADSLAKSIATGTGSQKKGQQHDKPKRQSKREKEREAQRQRQQDQQKEQQQRETKALMAEQARERQAFDRRRSVLLDRQARERESFEQEQSAPALWHDFNVMMADEVSR